MWLKYTSGCSATYEPDWGLLRLAKLLVIGPLLGLAVLSRSTPQRQLLGPPLVGTKKSGHGAGSIYSLV